MTIGIQDLESHGAAIVERLTPTPRRLRPFVERFAGHQAQLAAATKLVARALEIRDEAIGAVALADAAQDAAVEVLADALVGARMARRHNPFAGLSRHTPADVQRLACKLEAKEIQRIVAALAKKRPPSSVRSAMTTCFGAASAVLATIGDVTKPQHAYAKALAARDAILPEWTLALTKLKREAAALWYDDPATYRSTFAPPAKVGEAKPSTKSPTSKRATPSAPPRGAPKVSSE